MQQRFVSIETLRAPPPSAAVVDAALPTTNKANTANTANTANGAPVQVAPPSVPKEKQRVEVTNEQKAIYAEQMKQMADTLRTKAKALAGISRLYAEHSRAARNVPRDVRDVRFKKPASVYPEGNTTDSLLRPATVQLKEAITGLSQQIEDMNTFVENSRDIIAAPTKSLRNYPECLIRVAQEQAALQTARAAFAVLASGPSLSDAARELSRSTNEYVVEPSGGSGNTNDDPNAIVSDSILGGEGPSPESSNSTHETNAGNLHGATGLVHNSVSSRNHHTSSYYVDNESAESTLHEHPREDNEFVEDLWKHYDTAVLSDTASRTERIIDNIDKIDTAMQAHINSPIQLCVEFSEVIQQQVEIPLGKLIGDLVDPTPDLHSLSTVKRVSRTLTDLHAHAQEAHRAMWQQQQLHDKELGDSGAGLLIPSCGMPLQGHKKKRQLDGRIKQTGDHPNEPLAQTLGEFTPSGPSLKELKKQLLEGQIALNAVNRERAQNNEARVAALHTAALNRAAEEANIAKHKAELAETAAARMKAIEQRATDLHDEAWYKAQYDTELAWYKTELAKIAGTRAEYDADVARYNADVAWYKADEERLVHRMSEALHDTFMHGGRGATVLKCMTMQASKRAINHIVSNQKHLRQEDLLPDGKLDMMWNSERNEYYYTFAELVSLEITLWQRKCGARTTYSKDYDRIWAEHKGLVYEFKWARLQRDGLGVRLVDNRNTHARPPLEVRPSIEEVLRPLVEELMEHHAASLG